MLTKTFPTFPPQGQFWLFLSGFYALWILAWLLRLGPVEHIGGPTLRDPNADTLYWTVLKLLVWIPPLMVYLRRVYGVGLWEYLGLSRWAQRGWVWGLAGSGLLAGFNLAWDLLTGDALLSPERFILGPFLNAILVAPVVEEVFFRGFVIRQLQGWWKNFWVVNLATSLAWVLAHWIGWHFKGWISFPESLMTSLYLEVLGFLFGTMNRWSGSLWTSLLLHMTYNLYTIHFWNYFTLTRPHP